MEIFQIDEHLYQSSMIDDVERTKMFDVCIDLAGGIDPDSSNFKIYLNWTIEDARLPDLDILKLVASFGYDLAYKKKMEVLVHCEQGINRASLINGMILWMKGMSGEEIVNYIRSKRPGALFNQNFVNYLVNPIFRTF
ncbi:MAG: dual specificity protein phosphatase family protein [Candidatus Methanoperedens sp.]|nr:MAG: dual specificity protein phosphatase family protein [Candidatus Methanoperedens sp.]